MQSKPLSESDAISPKKALGWQKRKKKGSNCPSGCAVVQTLKIRNKAPKKTLTNDPSASSRSSMSQDELHDLAQRDTPSKIEVPNTWQGLIVWGVARFGSGIVIAAVFGLATMEVYQDMREDRHELAEAYREATRVMQDVALRLEDQTQAIEKLTP